MALNVVLVTGIAGGLAQQLASELLRRHFQVIGIDPRPVTKPLAGNIIVYQTDYHKRKIEDIFRRHQPYYVIHLGRIGNMHQDLDWRFNINVYGSLKLLDYCLKYHVKRALVLSTYHIYGAHPHNHTPIYEDEPPRAGILSSNVADAVQFDSQVLTWMYYHPEVQTVLLRPCNIVGPSIKNSMSAYLRQPVQHTLLGFNPMMQFIHETDITHAVITAMSGDAVGVFNIAGKSALPLKSALALTKKLQLALPVSLMKAYLLFADSMPFSLPLFLIDFLRYPCIVSDEKFRRVFDWEPQINEIETIAWSSK